MEKLRELIEEISNNYLKTNEQTLAALSGSLNLVKKMFPRYSSFIMEFIQNADDSASTQISINLDKENVVIKNNGKSFDEKDVRSLCSIGESTKSLQDYIGYLGIGFKSIYLISNSIEIYSGGYSFKFKKNNWDHRDNFPWQILPIWQEKPEESMRFPYTIFKISFRSIESFSRIKAEVLELINKRIILFLRNVNEIEISIENESYNRKLIKSKEETKDSYEIYKISEIIIEDEVESIYEDYWLVFRETYNVNEVVKNDDMTKDWERDIVEKREVIIAFNLIKESGKFCLNKTELGTAHIGVYSFLPIKEVESGLNYIIQADFLTNPGRTDLARDCKWNEWLATCVYYTIVEKCIVAFLNHHEWKYEFVDILFSNAGGHPLFEDFVKTPLRKYLRLEKVLVSETGGLIRVDDAIYIQKELRNFLKPDDLNQILPNKIPIHSKSKIRNLQIEKPFSFNATRGGSEEFIKLLEIKAEKKDVNFFKYIYKNYILPYKGSSNSTIYNLMKKDILLTDDYKIVDSSEAMLNLKQIKIPNNIEKEFNIIHPKIIKDQDIKDFFINVLSLEELTEKDLEKILKGKEIPELRENWPKMSENDKIKTIYYYKSLFDDEQLDNDSLNSLASFIEIKSKKGDWVKSKSLVFTQKYIPSHILEDLITIFTPFIKQGIPLKKLNETKFVNEIFIQEKSEDGVISWYNFFKKLGVDSFISENKGPLSEDLGILCTLFYEEKNSRIGNVITKKVGFDVKSIDTTSNLVRIIESKGSGSRIPDINVTANEYSVLIDKTNAYVYVITDALLDPTIHIIKGRSLLSPKKDMRFEYSDWIEIEEEAIKVLGL